MSIPSPYDYPDWREWASAVALMIADSTGGVDPASIPARGESIPPLLLPSVPTGFRPVWLSDDEARLYMGNSAYDPPVAPDLFLIDTAKLADAAVATNKVQAAAITNAKLLDAVVDTLKLAATAVTNAKVATDAIASVNIQNAAIIAAKLAAASVDAINLITNAVTGPKINDLAVSTSKLALLAVDAAQLANLAVSTGKLADNAVTTTKITDASIVQAKIGLLAVGAAQIIDLAVTTAKIGLLAVGAAQIALLAVGSAQIADAAIVTAKIGTAAVLTANIGTANITSALIADANILSAKILDAAVVTAKIANAAIITALIGDLQVVTGKIADLAVNNAKVANAAIDSAKIANLAVGSAHIQLLAVGAAQIANLAVGTAQIADLSVVTAKIADGAITNLKIGNTIQSTGWNPATHQGWLIDKAGNIQGSSLTLYDTAGNLIFSSGGLGSGVSLPWTQVANAPKAQLFSRNLIDLTLFKPGQTFLASVNYDLDSVSGLYRWPGPGLRTFDIPVSLVSPGPQGKPSVVAGSYTWTAAAYAPILQARATARDGFDPKKSYRVRIWVRLTTTGNVTFFAPDLPGGPSAVQLGGFANYIVNDFGGGGSANGPGAVGVLGNWYQLIGIVHGSDYAGANSGKSGTYDETGKLLSMGYDFKNNATATSISVICYGYSSIGTGKLEMAEPIIEELSGAPSIDSLFGTYGATYGVNTTGFGTLAGISQITSGNASTYLGSGFLNSATFIASGIIGSAAIASAAILSAHIASAQILDAHIVSLSASKITATSLSAITATIGTLRTTSSGQRMELKDNLLQVYDSAGVVRVEIGLI